MSIRKSPTFACTLGRLLTRSRIVGCAVALVLVAPASARANPVPVPVSFSAPVSGPLGLVFGDFNGDGAEDFVAHAASPLTNSITVTLSDGHGGYGAPVNYLAGTEIPGFPGSTAGVIKVADVNNDDHPDLVVANANGPSQVDASVSVLLGDPGGTFGAPTTYFPAGNVLVSLAVGDLNHDGLPDIVAADGDGGGGFFVLLGTGGGAFAPAIHYATDGLQGSIAVADFNGDSWPDVVTSDGDCQCNLRITVVYLNDKHGGFDHGTTVEDEIGQVLVADLDGDGRPDIVINEDFQIMVVHNTPDGSYPKSPIQTAARSVDVADFNGDSHPDLALSVANTNFVRVQLGNGDGTFGTGTDFPGGNNPNGLAVGDLNSDAKPDIIVANGGGIAVLFNTTTTDTTPPTASLTQVGSTNQLANPYTVSWSGADKGGSGVASYDVRYRKAAWNGSFGPYVLARSTTPSHRASFSGVAGFQYCYSVLSRDGAGNVSPWTAERCTAFPLDDRSLARSGGWSAKRDGAYLYGTYLQAAKAGKTLTLARVPGGRAALIIGTGPGYGGLSVSYNGRVVKRISLSSARTRTKVVVALPTVTKRTTVVVSTTTRKQVRVDGILLARR